MIIERSDDGRSGVKFFDQEGELIEFAEFAKDGQGLKYPCDYKHIEIDPINKGDEAQLVTVH